jgi:hypothetical protein
MQKINLSELLMTKSEYDNYIAIQISLEMK